MQNFAPLIIPQTVKQTVETYLSTVLPEEGCGFLLGRYRLVSEFHPAENELHSPVAYLMSPHDQIRIMLEAEERDLEILAIIHSHPNGPLALSQTDLKEAKWFDQNYLIVSFQAPSTPIWRGWYLKIDNYEEIPLVFDPVNEMGNEI